MLVYIAEVTIGEFEQEFTQVLGVFSEFEKAEAAVVADHAAGRKDRCTYRVRCFEVNGRFKASYHPLGVQGWNTSLLNPDGTWHITSGVVKVG
jgi:hypothetical protein